MTTYIIDDELMQDWELLQQAVKLCGENAWDYAELDTESHCLIVSAFQEEQAEEPPAESPGVLCGELTGEPYGFELECSLWDGHEGDHQGIHSWTKYEPTPRCHEERDPECGQCNMRSLMYAIWNGTIMATAMGSYPDFAVS